MAQLAKERESKRLRLDIKTRFIGIDIWLAQANYDKRIRHRLYLVRRTTIPGPYLVSMREEIELHEKNKL